VIVLWLAMGTLLLLTGVLVFVRELETRR